MYFVRTLSESRMLEIGTSGLMSGEGKRAAYARTAPLLDSTEPNHPNPGRKHRGMTNEPNNSFVCSQKPQKQDSPTPPTTPPRPSSSPALDPRSSAFICGPIDPPH